MLNNQMLLNQIIVTLSVSMLWLFVSPTKLRQVLEVFKWNKDARKDDEG
ncbi:MAG: hypothetical protein JXR70_01720 [Spirochaetales bacterium]|nr:hypothetical protein [Spirochaetales bacterium]